MKKYNFTNRKNYLTYLKSISITFVLLLTYTVSNAQFYLSLVSNDGGTYGNFSFVDEKIGFHFTDDGILKTINGGDSWYTHVSNIFTLTKADAKYPYGHFVTEDIGWVVVQKYHTNNINDSSYLYKTTDGGITWNLQRINPPNTIEYGAAIFGDVFFKNENEGWIFGDGLLEHTTDGGNTWNTIIHHIGNTSNNDIITDISIGSTNNIYAVGFGTWILKSEDAGTTFQTQSWTANILNDDYFQYGVDFINADTGMIAVGHGIFRTTFDGGATWTTSHNGYPDDNNSIAFVPNEQTVFMAAGSYCNNTGCYESASLLYSTDFGITWEELVNTPGDDKFVDIVWPSPHYGFVCQANGNIYKIKNLSPVLPDTTVVNGIANISKNSISVFPSPATDKLNITHNDVVKHIKIRNIHGQYLIEETLIENVVPLSHFSSGVYFIELYDEKNSFLTMKKFIKD